MRPGNFAMARRKRSIKEDKTMNKKVLWIIAGVVGLAILAGAAFLAPRLFHPVSAEGKSSAGAAGPAGMKRGGPVVNETELPAEELPQRDYDLSGTVSRIKDNSIFIEPAFQEGEAEIVVTQDTKIYLLAGRITVNEGKDGAPAVYRPKLDLVTMNDLVFNDILSVWAEKRGDRYIAEVIRVLH
jgi:hypothetical protein